MKNMFLNKKTKYKQYNDNELIKELVATKNNFIIGIIYERYSYLVMGVCLKYLKDEADAKDICSKVFEELEGKILRYEIKHFKSWLFQLVKNECLMFIRQNKFSFISSSEIEDFHIDFETKEILEEKLKAIEIAIPSLNNEQKNAITLFYLEDKSYQEISNLSNIDLNKVKSLIQNGKRNLKNILLQNNLFKDEY